MTHDAGRDCCAEYGQMKREIEGLKKSVEGLKVQRDNALRHMEAMIERKESDHPLS